MELLLLMQDKKKSIIEIESNKNSIIDDIKSINKNDIKNTPQIEKTYTLWERIKRTLGMS